VNQTIFLKKRSSTSIQKKDFFPFLEVGEQNTENVMQVFHVKSQPQWVKKTLEIRTKFVLRVKFVVFNVFW
jgi:hypothetical protein